MVEKLHSSIRMSIAGGAALAGPVLAPVFLSLKERRPLFKWRETTYDMGI